MRPCTTETIRHHLLTLYSEQLNERGLSASDLPDGFDLLLEGIIDSLGVLELMNRLEDDFQVTIDLEGLDAELITVVGPLCEYVARTAKPKSPVASAPGQ